MSDAVYLVNARIGGTRGAQPTWLVGRLITVSGSFGFGLSLICSCTEFLLEQISESSEAALGLDLLTLFPSRTAFFVFRQSANCQLGLAPARIDVEDLGVDFAAKPERLT